MTVAPLTRLTGKRARIDNIFFWNKYFKKHPRAGAFLIPLAAGIRAKNHFSAIQI